MMTPAARTACGRLSGWAVTCETRKIFRRWTGITKSRNKSVQSDVTLCTMKTTRKIITGLAGSAVIGGSLVALASSASAATPVTATTHLTQRPDSGYNSASPWALDNLTRTATITGGDATTLSLCATAANPTP